MKQPVMITPSHAMRLLYESIVDHNINPEISAALRDGTFVPNWATVRSLQEMVFNRRLDFAWITQLAAKMIAGTFAVDSSTVGVSKQGRVINGFHRLLACVLSGVPFETYDIAYGMESKAIQTIDGEMLARPYAQTQRLQGVPNATTRAGIAANLYRYHTNNYVNAKMTGSLVNAIVAQLDAEEVIQEAARAVNSSPKGISPSGLGFLFVMGVQVNRPLTEEFVNQVKTGLNLTASSPAHHLRQRLTQRHFAGKSYPERVKLAFGIKALNAELSGRDISSLRFRLTGDSAEEMPEVIGVPRRFAIGTPLEKQTAVLSERSHSRPVVMPIAAS